MPSQGIKGINWITLLGRGLISEGEIEEVLRGLSKIPEVTAEQREHGCVLIVGSEPVAGDQHWPDRSLGPYYAVANTLKHLFLTSHPDFSGERFITNRNTVGWIRRFIDPNGWR